MCKLNNYKNDTQHSHMAQPYEMVPPRSKGTCKLTLKVCNLHLHHTTSV